MSFSPGAAPLFVAAIVLAACGNAPPPIAADPKPAPPPPAAIPPDAGAHSICALAEPRASDDACSADSDCAPATPCHASKCVARANAQPRPKGLMCTQELRCGTVDTNPCGCWQGKCALMPASAAP